jgi:hypothetical protein
MIKSTIVTIIVLLFAAVASAQNVPNIRFVNALEGKTLSIQTDHLPQINDLAFTESTNYTAVVGGSLSVMVVDNSTGALFNSSQLVLFSNYCTVAIVSLNGTFALVPFNETVASSMINNFVAPNSTAAPTRYWVRVINTASAQITLFPQSQTNTALFSYVGFLQATPYVEVNETLINQFIITKPGTTTAITVVANAANSTAYTIFAFNSTVNSNGVIGDFIFDRFIPFTQLPVTTGIQMTTGQQTNVTVTGGTGMTTGKIDLTTQSVINTQTGDAQNLLFATCFTVLAALCAF